MVTTFQLRSWREDSLQLMCGSLWPSKVACLAVSCPGDLWSWGGDSHAESLVSLLYILRSEQAGSWRQHEVGEGQSQWRLVNYNFY